MSSLTRLNQIHTCLSNEGVRALIILKGELGWALQVFEYSASIFASLNNEKGNKLPCKIYSGVSELQGDINRTSYVHQLGTENQSLLFVDPNLNIDAFSALTGTIIAGGVCFLWCGSGIDDWASGTNFFGQRLTQFHQEHLWHFTIEEHNVHLFEHDADDFLEQSMPRNAERAACEDKSITEVGANLNSFAEQDKVIVKLVEHIKSDSNLPVVLTADRGRGKSAALAFACAELLTNEHTAIELVITAPNRAALGVFYQHLSSQLNQLLGAKSTITIRNGGCNMFNNRLTFLPVDQALIQADKHTTILVDEAAGIPVYLLKQLVETYQQSIFSSTVHGYEGAGKGFTVKFLSYLNFHFKKYFSYHLTQPIRWQQDDPLEQLLFDVCLLNTDLSDVEPFTLSTIEDKHEHVVEISTVELSTNESLLRQIFSILVTAHYQTKPSDLKMMLEHPSIQVFATLSGGNVLAVALTMNEGKLEQTLIQAIKEGKRRIKSHFLPQSILTQCLNEQAFNFSYLRVMRIAVHPQLQQQGLGQKLLSFIRTCALEQGIDILGTSFAANSEVCKFWLKAHYSPIRIGFTADASSGEHSIMMLNGLQPKSNTFLRHLTEQFYHSFDYLLVDEYQKLNVELVKLILMQQHLCADKKYTKCLLSAHDIKAITAYTKGQAQYSYVVMSLHRWLLMCLSQNSLNELDVSPLISRILMKHSISEVCERFQLKGKKALNQYMITIVKESLSDITSNSL